MASPRSRLLELLEYEGVSAETKGVMMALLHCCNDDTCLSDFVLHSLEAHFPEEFSSSIASAIFRETCACRSPSSLSKVCLCRAIADALNIESNRWASDFLLIAIGKRRHRGRSVILDSSYIKVSGNGDKGGPLDASSVAEMVRLRDGPRCCMSGSIDEVSAVQIVPVSQDSDRLNRFLLLAGVFFQDDMAYISNDRLCSPANTVLLSSFWKDCLDEGRLLIELVAEEYRAKPMDQNDTNRLVDERKQNGLMGSSILNLCGGPISHHFEGLDPKLVQLHRAIIATWQQTGISSQFLNEMRWVDGLPNDHRAMDILGEPGFRKVLWHKLMIM